MGETILAESMTGALGFDGADGGEGVRMRGGGVGALLVEQGGNGATHGPTDEALMQGVQNQEPRALAILYERYHAVLKSLVMRIIHNEAEADDLVQEIYMELWRHAGNYSPQKGKPLGWIVTLSRRRAIDRLRKRQSYARVEERLQKETEQQPEAWVHNTVDSDIESSDLRQVLMRVIAVLPTAQQEAIHLTFFKGMSQREISAHTGIPLGTIKTRLELGLKKIADGLKGLRAEL